MITAGIDVGAGATKVVILKEGKILSFIITPTVAPVARTAEEAMTMALHKASLTAGDIGLKVSTGCSRKAVPFADKMVTEVICHAKGAYFLEPAVRTVIDIGCQDSKVMRVNEKGEVLDFVMNDKCAAGTGRFIEVMATAMGVPLSRMGEKSLLSKNACRITPTCTIFAESEVISLCSEGKLVEDIIAGVHRAVSSRVVNMGARLGFESEIFFTGGVAKNQGIQAALQELTGKNIGVPVEPQIVGALGAAVIGAE